MYGSPTGELVGKSVWIKITNDPLDLNAINDWCVQPQCGSVVNFVGTTRDFFEDKKVTYLEYEAATELALEQLETICHETLEKYKGTVRAAIHHRIGRVNICETSIICSISSEHRKEGFEACEFMMHDLKANVAVWKKEFFDDGDSVWKENKEQFENKPKD